MQVYPLDDELLDEEDDVIEPDELQPPELETELEEEVQLGGVVVQEDIEGVLPLMQHLGFPRKQVAASAGFGHDGVPPFGHKTQLSDDVEPDELQPPDDVELLTHWELEQL